MITDNEYLASGAVSQSRLKKILKHPYFYIHNQDTEDDEPKEVTLIGDGVDILLTQGEDHFHENIVIASVERPSGQMGDYVWSLYKNRNKENPEQLAYDEAGFRRDTFEKVKERFKTEGIEYYNQLLDSETKKVISASQYNTIRDIEESLKTNMFTSKYFVSSKFERMYQVPLYGIWGKHKMKGLLDMIIYDTDKNQIHPIDIKTTSKSLHFFDDTIFNHRYDFQAAFYLELINQNIGSISKHFNVPSTPQIMPFTFIVESQVFVGNPLIFKMSEESLNIGRVGGRRKNKIYEGFTQAFERLDYHLSCDMWNYRKEDYESYGVRIV